MKDLISQLRYNKGALKGMIIISKKPGRKAGFYVFKLLNYQNYCTSKVMGKVYLTPTGLPRCLPGIIFGNNCTTRIASFSRRA